MDLFISCYQQPPFFLSPAIVNVKKGREQFLREGETLARQMFFFKLSFAPCSTEKPCFLDVVAQNWWFRLSCGLEVKNSICDYDFKLI